jgi:hypothetical protein
LNNTAATANATANLLGGGEVFALSTAGKALAETASFVTGGKSATINNVGNFVGRFQNASAALMLNSAAQLEGGSKMSTADLAANARIVSGLGDKAYAVGSIAMDVSHTASDVSKIGQLQQEIQAYSVAGASVTSPSIAVPALKQFYYVGKTLESGFTIGKEVSDAIPKVP